MALGSKVNNVLTNTQHFQMQVICNVDKCFSVVSSVASITQLTKLQSSRGTTVCTSVKILNLLQWEAVATTRQECHLAVFLTTTLLYTVSLCPLVLLTVLSFSQAHCLSDSSRQSGWFPHLMDKIAGPRVFLSTESQQKPVQRLYAWWGCETLAAGNHGSGSSSMYPVCNTIKQQQLESQEYHQKHKLKVGFITVVNESGGGSTTQYRLEPICYIAYLTTKMPKKGTHLKPHYQLFYLLPNSTRLCGQQELNSFSKLSGHTHFVLS